VLIIIIENLSGYRDSRMVKSWETRWGLKVHPPDISSIMINIYCNCMMKLQVTRRHTWIATTSIHHQFCIGLEIGFINYSLEPNKLLSLIICMQ